MDRPKLFDGSEHPDWEPSAEIKPDVPIDEQRHILTFLQDELVAKLAETGAVEKIYSKSKIERSKNTRIFPRFVRLRGPTEKDGIIQMIIDVSADGLSPERDYIDIAKVQENGGALAEGITEHEAITIWKLISELDELKAEFILSHLDDDLGEIID